jgi:4-hydroxy-3-methylbut-2-enyl diphosphate reductase
MKNKKFIVEYIAMKINLAKHSGFCFGVKRAIQIAKETASDCSSIYPTGEKPPCGVYIKGDLVHNEEVCSEIERKGIKKVNSIQDIPKNSTLVIKAHGEPLKTYKEAKLKSLKIVDATCPMVKDIHRKAKKTEDNGYQIIIIGDRNHEETIGILGNIKSGLVLENKEDINQARNKISKKVAVFCQSTQNIENVSSIISCLVGYAEELLFINTICQPTRLRQNEIKEIASGSNVTLIVGSKKSANTKRLYNIARKINKNTFWISNTKTLKRCKFIKFRSIGIIGGASTPKEVLENIYNKLQ